MLHFLLFLTWNNDGVKGNCVMLVTVANLSELRKEDVFAKHFLLVSDKKQQQIANIRQGEERIRSLGAARLLQISMNSYFHTQNEYYPTAVDSMGKPYLLSHAAQFSLSHSGMYAACVIDELPIGIDIQEMDREITDMHYKILTAQELEFLTQYPSEQERQTCFFKIWSAKESYMKAIGSSMLQAKKIAVADQNGLYTSLTQATGTFYFYHLLMEKYTLSICRKTKKISKNLSIDWKDDIF